MSLPLACVALLVLTPWSRAQSPSASEPVPALVRLRDGGSREVDASTWTPERAREAGFLILDVRAGSRPHADALPAQRLEAELAGGERLIGAVRSGKGDDLEIELGPGVPARIGIDALVALRFHARLAAGESAALEPAPSGDRLYRASAGRVERVDGTFEAFRDEGIAFESVLGKGTFAWGDVIALFVEGAGAPEASALAAAGVCVDLEDGSRLFATWLGSSARGLEIERGGVRATLAWPWVDELSLRSEDFAFLSALAPTRVEASSPFGDDLGFTFSPRWDRAVDGGPLTAGGRTWRRGLGVHAPSRIVWTLAGDWRELRGAVALDDQVLRLPSRGSVKFRILLDGRVAWESGVVRGGDAPREWPAVSLSGARELALEVDPTEDLHVADRADWLAPYLVR